MIAFFACCAATMCVCLTLSLCCSLMLAGRADRIIAGFEQLQFAENAFSHSPEANQGTTQSDPLHPEINQPDPIQHQKINP